jgi:hypothetical protein
MFALIGLLGVAGCGNETESSSNTEIVRTLVAAGAAKVKGNGAGGAAAPLTRARLAEVVTPVMLATVENTGNEALIAEIQVNGDVATWSTVDDITISMRKGVIVATRGFGADLMAASVPAVSRQSGGGAGHNRVHTLLNGEDQPVRTAFSCQFQNHGPQDIEIVQIKYRSTYITEDCRSDKIRFKNEYWISDDQKMRKSRQWISPQVGFFIIQDVRR